MANSVEHGVVEELRDARGRRKILRDAIVVLLATSLAAVLCARFDISEALFRWTRRFEWLQFDELPAVLLVFAFGFIWFSARRYREAGAMLAQQKIVDARLSASLAENRLLTQQYLSAQESERKHLARELHDELGQYLNAIKIDAVSIRDSQRESDATTREPAAAITHNVDHVYSVVTELIRRLRPVGLDELGLIAAIEHCVDQWRRRLPNIQITLSAEGDFSGLSEQTNLTVYRVTQESLTNAAKYSQASEITLALYRSTSAAEVDEVSVQIADNGVGTDLREPKQGFGLASMRERVEMQRGKFEIRSTPSCGFILNAHIPAHTEL